MAVKKKKKKTGLNKGNWSELFAFLKILSDRQLQLADKNLEAIPYKVFAVKQVLKNDEDVARTYDVSSNEKIQLSFRDISNGNNENREIDYLTIEEHIPELLELIQNGSGYFKLPEMDELLQVLNYGAIATESASKGDIKIVIHDYVTNMANEIDFSIKSFIGADPTLLNAGKVATNLIFTLSGKPLDAEEINSISGYAKVKKRFAAIEKGGAKLTFQKMLSPQFQKNLRKIDSLMPIFLSEYVRAYYTTKATKLTDLTKEVAKSEIIKNLLDVPFSEEDIKYKIKQLLINSALGMVPQTDWDGFFKADGGYIVVKKDGKMLCFHIYNIAQLGEYLFENTKFDTPSTSPDKFDHAYVFEEGKQQYFKINFQIRFLKPKKKSAYA